MRINHNISALNAWRQLSQTDNALNKSLERLSSGLRINRAADDAAGLAISEKMRGQIRGLNQAVRNAQDGISLIQTAEGALQETHSILQRMRELAVQASNDTNTTADRIELQKEVDQLAKELTRISNTTEFNTKNLLAGGFANQYFAVGANKGQTIGLTISAMDAYSLGVTARASTVNVLDTVESTYVTSASVTSSDLTGTLTTGAYIFRGEITQATGTYSIIVWTALDENNNVLGTASATSTDGNVSIGLNFDGDANFEATVSITFDSASLNVLSTGTTVSPSYFRYVSTNSAAAETTNNGQVLVPGTAEKGILIDTQEKANAAIATIDNALVKVSAERAKLGALQNRLEHTINNLGVAAENLTAAESRIRDVDMAQEMMQFVKNQILLQSGTAMLAQANVKPQAVLQLLA